MFHDPELNGLTEYRQYHLAAGQGDLVKEDRLTIDTANGRSLYQLLSPDGIDFFYYQSKSAYTRSLICNNAAPLIQLHFSIHNNCIFSDHSKSTFAHFQPYEYNILSLPAGEINIDWTEEGKTAVFMLNITPDIFLRYLMPSHPFFQVFSQSSLQQAAATLSSYNLPIIPKIHTILYDILNCPLNLHYKQLYLRAKVVELLLLVCSHFEEYIAVKNATPNELQKVDIEKMQKAREILHNNIQNPCSLIDLAHQVGTNDNYLKKHFKQVFGQTVFGYIHEVRMQEAKRLLLNDGVSINEVARLTGYKHTQHFITAFKKFFGYPPSANN